MTKILLYIATILVLISVGTFVYIKTNPQPVTIPENVAKENEEKKLTEYIPGWLPGTYQVDQDSFSREEGQVFTFSATDENRDRLFFSQQPVPEDFDFEKFYATKVTDPVLLENVPYESFYARDVFGKAVILSIKAENTWIMMTTTAPIDQVMAQKIAQEMKEY